MAEILELFQSDAPRCILYVLWATGGPAILTSGTLLSGGSLARIKQMLGLERNIRTGAFEALSPFNYKQNRLLYILRDMPPLGNRKNVEALAQHIEELVKATHGHALVLLTSYRLMSEVHTLLWGSSVISDDGSVAQWVEDYPAV